MKIKNIKTLRRIPLYVVNVNRYLYNIVVRKRVPFTYESTVSDWEVDGARLPQFSARLYKEVKLLREAIGCYHAKRSLEIGCGFARLTPWIAEHSEEHHAVEPESVLFNEARKLCPNVCFHQAKAQKLPFSDGYFDLCMSWTVLQHVPPREIGRAAEEMKRVCTPNAVIILAEAVGERRRALSWKDEFSGYWEYTLEEWKDLFSPWKLVSCTERKIEEVYKGVAGRVMRFEKA